jgi:hypothetical protein
MAVADGSPRLRNSPGSPPVIVVSKDIGLSVQPQSGGRRWSGTDRRDYPEIKWHSTRGFYKKLTCPKAEHVVRSVDGGEAHCKIEFDWLDGVFK